MRCFESAFLVWYLLRPSLIAWLSGLRTLNGGPEQVVELCDVVAFPHLMLAESTLVVDVFGGITESGGLDQDLV